MAEVYDDAPRGDEAAAVAFLEQLAGADRRSELAIGTGRIALPLAARGIRVDGIDFSPAMVAQAARQARRRRSSRSRSATSPTCPSPGAYRLIYVVYNTLFNLLTQDDQVRCFENVAAHLTDDGLFVVEAFVPAYLYRLRDDQYVDAERIDVDEVRLDVGRHDPWRSASTRATSSCPAPGVRCLPIVARYAWPSELDLMARIAGLRLGALERLGARAVHRREPAARLGLWALKP